MNAIVRTPAKQSWSDLCLSEGRQRQYVTITLTHALHASPTNAYVKASASTLSLGWASYPLPNRLVQSISPKLWGAREYTARMPSSGKPLWLLGMKAARSWPSAEMSQLASLQILQFCTRTFTEAALDKEKKGRKFKHHAVRNSETKMFWGPSKGMNPLRKWGKQS